MPVRACIELRAASNRTRRRWAASAATLIIACITPPDAAADTGPARCRIDGISHEVQCGSVQRPLDPDRPESTQIDIHYVVVPAMARRKHADPVLLLAGGPGQSAIGLAPAMLPLLARLNNRRDLIFVDQRGTGRSAPLECDEPRDEPLAARGDPQRQRARLVACRDQLAKLPQVQGAAGLRLFTTTIAMQDFDAVRRHLGATRWNLVGASYGTRAALELLRQFPSSVRRAALDGAAPPDMALPASMSTDSQAALDATFSACEREAACQRAHPQLRRDWATLLAALPRVVQVNDPHSGQPESVTLTREMLLGAVRSPLYVPALGAALPSAISAAAAGRFEALAALNAMLVPRPGRRPGQALASGMHFSVICAEDVPRIGASSDTPGRDFGDTSRRLYQEVCADWPRGHVPPEFYRIAPSSAPVLLLSGGLDPVTPPRHGARVAAALGAKATHRVIANAGHGLIAIGCVRDLLFRFIDAADDSVALAVDSRCVEGIPRPPAFLPVGASPVK